MVVLSAVMLTGCGGGGGERHGGYTESDAESAVLKKKSAACPGLLVKVVRCTPRRDAWRCDYEIGGNRGTMTVAKRGEGAVLSTICPAG